MLREGFPSPTCHVSCVLCHVSHVTFYFILFFIGGGGQCGKASWWRVRYQLGLPRLLYISNNYIHGQLQKILLGAESFNGSVLWPGN